MLCIIEKLFNAAEVQDIASVALQGRWMEGALTAGSQASKVKSNLQLQFDSDASLQLQNQIVQAIGQHPLFCSAALPQVIYPPNFNLYQNGGHYGTHVDNAVLTIPSTGQAMRSDISATVFLSDPSSYTGGELVIETEFGAQEVKLEAGDMVVYSSSSLHRVNPVTEGMRLASFFWVQSLVRDVQHRSMLFDLDQSIQRLTLQQVVNPALSEEVATLTSLYHNLIRRWAEF